MKIEEILSIINTDLNEERKLRNIKHNGILIASKTIDIVKPFEGFKSYNITIYLFTEGKKYKVLTSQITEKSNIVDENVIFNKVELELIKSILKIYKNTFEYLKLVECNYN